MLGDVTIRRALREGRLEIDPVDESCIEPASVDLHLGRYVRRVTRPGHESVQEPLSLAEPDTAHIEYEQCDLAEDTVTLNRGELLLATTHERVRLPDDWGAFVTGRSSLGRLGVSIHQTAGYIDPGFDGQITLELANHGPVPVELSADLRICQIMFEQVVGGVTEPYGGDTSQYQHQSGPTPSGLNFD